MVNPQRPDDHEHLVSPEPDVEGHAAADPADAEEEDEDTEGHGLYQPPNDDEDDTEAHAEF